MRNCFEQRRATEILTSAAAKRTGNKRVQIGGLIRTIPADDNDRAEGMIRKHWRS
jgi:hypothetical protein